MDEKYAGIALMRKPFLPNQVSRLPKPTASQTAESKTNQAVNFRCKECGGWHHKKVVHLDYVGHAALTDRLLDVDPEWNWEPLGLTEDGFPKFDSAGGLWIRLTVLGVTRIGYGAADGKKGSDAIKEIIGDALRNAGMRFGAALDLWHKGNLHDDCEPEAEGKDQEKEETGEKQEIRAKPELLTKNREEWVKAIAASIEGRLGIVREYRSISKEVLGFLTIEAEALRAGITCEKGGEKVEVRDCSTCKDLKTCDKWK